ncbi:MAG: zf-HC2 domain-containing protein [Oscillospiraceae bacterium]|nr:zf-HC2 domain-containing protein [Oscillospiraceae bacterium]
MDHAYYEELIGAAADGELTAEEQETLRAHLEQCESCRAFYQAVRAVSGTLAADEPALPENFTENVMRAVRAQAAAPSEQPKKKGVIIPMRVKNFATVAAAILILVGGLRLTTVLNAASARKSASAAPQAAQADSVNRSAAAAGAMEEAAAEAPADNAPMMSASLYASDAEAEEPGGAELLLRGDEILWQGEPVDQETLEELLSAEESVELQNDGADAELLESVTALLDQLEIPYTVR